MGKKSHHHPFSVQITCQNQRTLTCTGTHAGNRVKGTVVQNSLIMGLLIIHFSMCLGVIERVSKRMSAVKRMSNASSAEQANECAVQNYERIDE